MSKTEAYLRLAEAAEREAGRTYNTVEYAEHLAAARAWRELARQAACEEQAEDTP